MDGAEGNLLSVRLTPKPSVSPSTPLPMLEPESRHQRRRRVRQPATQPLRIGVSWTMAGNVAYYGGQWVIFVLLAKLSTPEMVGRLALALAVTAPIFTFAGLQLRTIITTDSLMKYDPRDCIALRLITSSCAVAAACFASLAYPRGIGKVIAIISIAKLLESASDILHGFLQRAERFDLIAWSMIAKAAIACTAAGLLFVFWPHAAAAGLALCLAWAVLLVTFDIPVAAKLFQDVRGSGEGSLSRWSGARLLKPSWRPTQLRRLAYLTFPLGVTMMLASLNINLPRYFVAHSRGEVDVGVLAAVTYFGIAGNQLIMALGAVASPRMAHYHTAQKREEFLSIFRRFLLGAFGLAITGVVGAMLLGDHLLRIFYSAQYVEHRFAFTLAMLAAGLGYITSVFGYAATAQWRLRTQPAGLALVLLVLAAACHVLVPRYGLVGALWASIVSQLVGLACFAAIAFSPSRIYD